MIWWCNTWTTRWCSYEKPRFRSHGNVSDMKDFEEQALSFAPTAPKIWITLCWRHFYHVKTKWCRKSSTAASQHSTTNHPFYNGDWEWQHILTHWSLKIQKDASLQVFTENLRTHQCALWLTPLMTHTNDPQSVKRGVVKCLYDRSKRSSLNHRLSLRKRSI